MKENKDVFIFIAVFAIFTILSVIKTGDYTEEVTRSFDSSYLIKSASKDAKIKVLSDSKTLRDDVFIFFDNERGGFVITPKKIRDEQSFSITSDSPILSISKLPGNFIGNSENFTYLQKKYSKMIQRSERGALDIIESVSSIPSSSSSQAELREALLSSFVISEDETIRDYSIFNDYMILITERERESFQRETNVYRIKKNIESIIKETIPQRYVQSEIGDKTVVITSKRVDSSYGDFSNLNYVRETYFETVSKVSIFDSQNLSYSSMDVLFDPLKIMLMKNSFYLISETIENEDFFVAVKFTFHGGRIQKRDTKKFEGKFIRKFPSETSDGRYLFRYITVDGMKLFTM